jgi:glycosyltransferase involved in cell wall biosynthesis
LAELVSVIIPAYNRAAVIGAAIDSVLKQALPSAEGTVEIIVVDDASDDDLAAALRRFRQQVRLIRHDGNKGAAAARNTAIAAAGGDLLAFLDSDDIWLPGKLARQMAAMHQNGWEASCTAYLLSRPGTRDHVSPRLSAGLIELEQMVWGCFVSPGSTLMCRRSLFEEIGPFDPGLGRLEDWDWLLRYGSARSLGFLAEPLACIEPSMGGGRADKVLPALDLMWRKHASGLTPQTRRHFAAALDIERAAAFYRSGNRAAAVGSLSKSLLRVPFGNRAFAAVLHNRLARSA